MSAKIFVRAVGHADCSCLFATCRCEKSFATKDKLTRHRASHALKAVKATAAAGGDHEPGKARGGERATGDQDEVKLKHACAECHKPFLSNYHLKRHTKAVHEGPRPYKCEFAVGPSSGDEAGNPGAAGTEKRKETEVCRAAFSKKKFLREHMASVHGLDG